VAFGALTAGAALAAPSESPGSNTVSEVVVTATKRPEVVRKITGSVTAFTGDQLEKLGAQDMSDYLTLTPGVVFDASTPGWSTVVIRGVSTTTGIDQGQSTTGYFINDVPLTDPFYSIATPDIDAFDVNNVAILRGPQGTLFGSASLGGAINYQAAAPELGKFDAHLQATIEDTDHGGVGGSGKIMLNAPLGDTFALRAVYVYRDEAGYIDNVGTGKNNSNTTLIRGGRIEALWQPTPQTKISYLFLDQTENTKDLGYEQPVSVGAYEKDTIVPETSNFSSLIHSLRLDQDLGFGTLTAMASYHEKKQNTVEDLTGLLGPLLPGATPITILQPADSKGETYEVRLASKPGGPLDYLIGAMHDETFEHVYNYAEAPNAASVIDATYGPLFGDPNIGDETAPGGVFLNADIPIHAQESAVFGEATWHFNDQWKATLGGRFFDIKSSNHTVTSGFYDILAQGVTSTDQQGSLKQSGFTPKASITWTPSSDLMVYALADEGFRFGGPNLIASEPGFTVPANFKSDSLVNYEIGERSNLFDHRLQLDLTAFYIDWSNIQLHLETPIGLNYAANAGKAHIWGLEGATTWFIAPALTLNTSLTYLDSKLADPFSPGAGSPVVPSGTTLPGASKWRFSNILTYNWGEGPGRPTFVLIQRYVSKAPGIFLSGLSQGGYDTVDARAMFHLDDHLGVSLYVSNIGDARGVTSAFNGPEETFLVRPRTFGLTFDYRM
jgi:outer membrane receptor protein involved in Fe transport